MKRAAVSLVFLLVMMAVPAPALALVNINTADAAELDTLPEIGPTIAQRIIDYRIANGPYTAIEDVKNVKGIGDATFDKFKHLITVGSVPPPEEEEEDTPDTTEGEAEPAATTTPPAQTAQTPVSSYVAPPVPKIFADAGDDRTVIVGADTAFSGRAYDREQADVEPVRFSWNFGDGTGAEGASVLHHFDYPGRYAVTLSIAEERTSVTDRIIVVAEPAKLGFSAEPDGSVSIINRAGRDLDLSRWIVRNHAREFILPEHTTILAGATMRISQKTLGVFSSQESTLAYPNGVVAFRAGEGVSIASSTPSAARTGSSAAPEPAPKKAAKTVARTAMPQAEPLPLAEETGPPINIGVLEAAAASALGEKPSATPYWWLGAMGLAVLAGAAALVMQRMRRGEWDIIEEKEEDV